MFVQRAVASAALVLAATLGSAATTTTVLDVPTHGSLTQRFLHVRPDARVANVVVLSGGSGVLNIQDDGTMTTSGARCGPVVRHRVAFAARGLALGLVDRASDGSVQTYADVLEVLRYMRSRDDVPIWLVGGSSATLPLLQFATTYPSGEPLGLLVFSPGPVGAAAASVATAIEFYNASLDHYLLTQLARELAALDAGVTMVDRSVRDTMMGRGWLAKGDGEDLVVICAPR